METRYCTICKGPLDPDIDRGPAHTYTSTCQYYVNQRELREREERRSFWDALKAYDEKKGGR